MNSDETWLLYLWSGTIGSFVAAVVGGLVALLVVRLTNGQQRRAAAEAREVEAMAGFLSTVASIMVLFSNRDKFMPREFMTDLSSAVLKLHLAGPGVRKLAEALDTWPARILNMCTCHHIAETRKLTLPVDVEGEITTLSLKASFGLRHWFELSKEERAEQIEMINALTEEMGQSIVRINEVLDAKAPTTEAPVGNSRA